jgi:uncharacterized coiled-coil protein SlyX
MSDSSSLIALEIKVSFLEDTLQQLSHEILVLQKEMQGLKLVNQQLKSKVQTLQSDHEVDDLGQSDRPPHY